MKTILETERLILRELIPEDANLIFELNADKEVVKHTGDQSFNSIKEAREFLCNYQDYKLNGFGRWGVFIASNNEFIGWCGLKLHHDGFVDIGFRLMKKYWNKGFATEAASGCLRYGFEQLNLREIFARVAEENKASIKVLEKLNMIFVRKETCNGIVDANLYSINKTRFELIKMSNRKIT